MAVGDGSLWIANKRTGMVQRIDPDPLAQAASIQVGANPDSLAFGQGGIWVTNTDDGTVQRIPSGSEQAEEPIDVGSEPEGIAVGRRRGLGSEQRRRHGHAHRRGRLPEHPAGGYHADPGRGDAGRRLGHAGRRRRDRGSRPCHGRAQRPEGRIEGRPPRDRLWRRAPLGLRATQRHARRGRPRRRPRHRSHRSARGPSRGPFRRRRGMGHERPRGQGHGRRSADARQDEPIDVGGTPYGLAVGEGFVWAAGSVSGGLERIRPRAEG